MGGWGGLGSLKIGLVWFSGCLNELPFVGDMVADVFRCVFFVPDLQLPRVVEIAGVFEINVDTDIAVYIAQIPVFQAVLCFPVVQPFKDFVDVFRWQNHACAENKYRSGYCSRDIGFRARCSGGFCRRCFRRF